MKALLFASIPGITLLWQKEAVCYLILPLGSQQYCYGNKPLAVVKDIFLSFLAIEWQLKNKSYAETEWICFSQSGKSTQIISQIILIGCWYLQAFVWLNLFLCLLFCIQAFHRTEHQDLEYIQEEKLDINFSTFDCRVITGKLAGEERGFLFKRNGTGKTS